MSPKRVDSNQSEIVAGLREFGASVWDLHTVGHGPDLLVGYGGKSFPMEVKTLHGQLTADEKAWLDNWHGNYYIVHDIEEAIQILCDSVEE